MNITLTTTITFSQNQNQIWLLFSATATATLLQFCTKVGGSVIRRRKNGGVIANFHRFSDLDFRFFTVFPFHPQVALFIAFFRHHAEGNAQTIGQFSDFHKKEKKRNTLFLIYIQALIAPTIYKPYEQHLLYPYVMNVAAKK